MFPHVSLAESPSVSRENHPTEELISFISNCVYATASTDSFMNRSMPIGFRLSLSQGVEAKGCFSVFRQDPLPHFAVPFFVFWKEISEHL